MSKKPYKEGNLIVGFKEEVSKKDAKKILASHNLTISHEFKLINSFIIDVPLGKEKDWAGTLVKHNEVNGVDLEMFLEPA